MFASTKDKRWLLETATNSTLDGGFVLLVDTPKNLPIIESHFSSMKSWKNRFCKNGFRFIKTSQVPYNKRIQTGTYPLMRGVWPSNEEDVENGGTIKIL